MSLQVLIDLRDAIAANAALNATPLQRYQKPFGHLIGYDKGSPNADDRPLICYVPVQRKYNESVTQVTANASLVVQIIEDDTREDGVKNGVVIADGIAEQLVSFLKNQPLSKAFFSKFAVVTDLGTRHPFYEIEISFQFQARKTG